MSIFVRPVSKRCLVRLCCLVTVFVLMSLLITSVQELLDPDVDARAVSAISGSVEDADHHRCPSLDVLGAQLEKILVEWEAGAKQRSFGEQEVASLTDAVRTLTDNKVILEEDNAHRLLYLADVLQTFKEWFLMREDEGHIQPDPAEEDEDAAAMIEELVKALENVTRNQTVPQIYMNFYKDNRSSHGLPTWKRFHNEINQLSLYPEDSRWVDQLLVDMATLPIKSLGTLDDDGTQIKLVFYLEDGSRVLFKPKRLRRDQEESLDLYYMYEMERHSAEIAAHHLDRILGFRRVPPAAGRYVDMIQDIYKHANHELKDTFYKSPIGNECFYGLCEYFCDAGHGICGNGTTLEGSFSSYLPSRNVAPRTILENPWKRSYSKYDEAEWETTKDGREYCASVRRQDPWNRDSALLTVIDAHIFDFLTGNKDRHHFEVFSAFGNVSSPAQFDNGKGFSRATHDVISILAPLYQCCMIRYSTLLRLLELETAGEGLRLSDRMRQSLSNDVLQGILTEDHLEALDRRVFIVLDHVYDCIQQSDDVNQIVKDVHS